MVTKYSESSIQYFEGLDGVRKKPEMYLGSRGSDMIFQALKELVDNSVDEYLAERNKKVYVWADTKNNKYIVADEAQGIPVGLHKKANISTLTLIFTKIHAGGKFQDKAYSVSAGTHGVGAAATNAVSQVFRVWTNRNGKWYYQAFSKGRPKTKVIQKQVPSEIFKRLGQKINRGTIVYFEPDEEVVNFGKSRAATLPIDQTKEYCHNIANLNKNLAVNLCIDGKRSTHLNRVGITKLLSDYVKNQDLTVIGKAFSYSSKEIDIAIQWTSYPDVDGVFSYVSSSYTKDGGKHLDGMYDAITKSLAKYKTPKDKYSPKDLRFGLVGFFNFRMSGAAFSGQTKDRLVSDVSKQVESTLMAQLDKFWAANKTLPRKIIKRACDSKKSQEQFKKVLQAISEVKKGNKGAFLPGVLTAAKNCNPKDRELYIVEGGSAEGTAKAARDSSFQEILTLRGKPPNAMKVTPEKLLGNDPVKNILVSMGVDVKNLRPNSLRVGVENLRIGSLMLLSDADPDGRHINVLILTLLWRLMPDLFKQGRVYVVDAPLFFGFWKNKHYYGSTFEECWSKMKGAPKSAVTRAKGWGEVNADALELVAFSPKTRTVLQVHPPKGFEAVQWFEALVGEGSESRKKLLGL